MNAERQGSAGALSGPASRKLPVPPRERRPALAALALLLILGGALATTLLVLRSGDRVSAIQITQQVGTGQRIPLAAMQEVQIADTGIGYVSYADRPRVAENYARVTLLPGTLLTREMVVSSSAELGPGKARVGLALKPGQLPSGLAQGDRVQVIHVPGRGGAADAQGRVLAQAALVQSVGTSGRNGPSGQVTIIVDATVSPTITAYASNGEIALAELPGAR
ncbi:SAF domain-containing protein [Streptosporangium album]